MKKKQKNKTVLITTTTFADFDKTPIHALRRAGFNYIINPYKRRLEEKEVITLGKGAIGIIAGTERIGDFVFSQLPMLKVISRCGVGIDNIDLEAASKRKIKVYGTSEVPTKAVAELTIGLMLDLLRRASLMDRNLKNGIWKKIMGNLLFGKCVGIIGLGRIGKEVAKLVIALGAKVLYCDPLVRESTKSRCIKVRLNELLKKSDIITLHLSYSDKNYNLLSKNEFALIKKGAFLVNCSRGGIVDEKSLYIALKESRLAGAALDVFEIEPYNGPLKKLDNVILTPHIGSYALETRVKMEMQAVKNLLKGIKAQSVI